MRIAALTFLFFFLAGCRGDKKREAQNRARDAITERTAYIPQRDGHKQSEAPVSLTRDIAIGIALKKNRLLQAAFEQIGVSQAQLEQAGFFANPYLDGIFSRPYNDPGRTLSTALTFYVGILKVSDLWLVPIKKRMAEADLETVSWETVTYALDTIRDTHIAYNNCLRFQAQLRFIEEISTRHKNLITSYPQFEQTTMTFSCKLRTLLIHKRSQYRIALLSLEQLMGEALLDTVELAGDLEYGPQDTLHEMTHIMQAVKNHPHFMIAQARIDRAKHQLSFERGRGFEQVVLGYNYISDYDGRGGGGPLFHAEFPLGDCTHATISKARSLIAQREQEAEGAELLLCMKVQQLHATASAQHEELDITRNELIPHYKGIVAQSEQQIDVEHLETARRYSEALLSYCEANCAYIDLLYAYTETKAQQDYLLGGRYSK